jgi:hypothetical protein
MSKRGGFPVFKISSPDSRTRAAIVLFESGGGGGGGGGEGISGFFRVIKGNFAESLPPIISIYFSKNCWRAVVEEEEGDTTLCVIVS